MNEFDSIFENDDELIDLPKYKMNVDIKTNK